MSGAWQPEVRPASAVPGIGWLVLNSLWLLPVLGGFGRATWLGFALIGILALRTSWLVTAGVYAVAAAALAFVPPGDIATFGYPALWIVGIVHALIVNPAWLTEAWRRRENQERWLRRAPRPRPAAAPGPRVVDVPASPAATAPFGVDPSAYYAPQATPAAPDALASPAAPIAPPPAPAPAVDPQHAPAAALAALPFMGSARAEYVVAHRAAHPVHSLDDLIALLRLQPHEAVALRPFLAFAPAAAPHPAPPAGRILDV